jgi:hypothetical protein
MEYALMVRAIHQSGKEAMKRGLSEILELL